MLAQFRTIPNILSLTRLALVPVMWLLASGGEMQVVGICVLVCGLTDFLDGTIARRFDQCTALGAQLDSLADQLLVLSTISWVILYTPQMFVDNPFMTAVALILYLASLAVGLLKFQRLANLHLYSSKVAGVFLVALPIHAFLTGHYSTVLFYLAWATFSLSSLETLVMQLARDQVDEHQGSFFFPFLKGVKGNRNAPPCTCQSTTALQKTRIGPDLRNQLPTADHSSVGGNAAGFSQPAPQTGEGQPALTGSWTSMPGQEPTGEVAHVS